jgi:hypothetical protein
MSHYRRPVVQSRAGTLSGLRGDAAPWVRQGEGVNACAAGRLEEAMPTPNASVPTACCRLAYPACPCSEDRNLSVAAGAGLPTHKGAGTVEKPPKDQVRKGRPPGTLSTLIPQVQRRRLGAMTVPIREQPADPSRAANYPHSGPLPMREHPAARRYARLSAAFSPSRRRRGCRVRFDAARAEKAITAQTAGRPPWCAKEAIARTRAGGVGCTR